MEENYKKQTAILIPAYNESAVIGHLIAAIKKQHYHNIYVVDDGSSDNTFKIASASGATTLRHKVNRGKGAATRTAFEVAKLTPYRFFITMDADGQHHPADLDNLLEPLAYRGFDAVLGIRHTDKQNMPPLRRLTNLAADRFVKTAYRVHVTDTQCGFRAFSRYALNFISTTGDRYEFETEVLQQLRRHQLRFTEVPVRTIYSAYSLGKATRQDMMNGVVTLYKLLWKSLSF